MDPATPRLDRRTIELVYRAILGRPPEEERVYLYHLAHGTLDALRLTLLQSEEFAQVRAELRQRAEAGRQPDVATVTSCYFPRLDAARLAALAEQMIPAGPRA